MTARKSIEVGLKTIVVAIGLTIIFLIGATVSGMARSATAAAGAATAGAATQPANVLLLLFVASLVQAIVVAYMVLEAKWSSWKIAGALFLLVLNAWAQAAIDSVPYFRARGFQGHVAPSFATQAVVAGLVTAALFAPFAVWVLGGFGRAAQEEPSEHTHWSAARWTGTLAATTVAFVATTSLGRTRRCVNSIPARLRSEASGGRSPGFALQLRGCSRFRPGGDCCLC